MGRDGVKRPKYDWGDVKAGDVGTIVKIDGDDCLVSFPMHMSGFPLWWGVLSDMEYVEDSGPIEGVMAVNNRLFEDRASDPEAITIILADGKEHAHRTMLAAASEPLGAMMSLSMREGQTRTLELPIVKEVTMRVFLRLLYTGCSDPKDWHASSKSDVPLETLLGVSELARKYMVPHVLDAAIEALKLRLYRAAGDRNVTAFQEIWRGAIGAGIDLVRMAALQMVKDTAFECDGEAEDQENPTHDWGVEIKKAYDARGLLPEIQFELQAIWPPPKRPAKRRRLT